VALRRRDDLEAREAVDIARMAREGAGSVVYVGAVLGALVVALALSVGVQREWDLSADRSNSLSPQTVEVLKGLTEPVALYPLYGKRNELERDAYWRVLRSYRQESDRLSVEFVDPLRQPGRLQALGVDPRSQELGEGTTLVVRGDRRLTFRGREEEDITNAILEVGRTGRRVVGFLRGYGEHDPDSKAGGGYREAREALEREYYDVIDVELDRGIPDEVTVLVAAGPSLPIPAERLEALQSWLDAGGRLLALIEPDDASGLNDVTQRWGLRVTSDVVVDPRSNVNESEQFVKVTSYERHPAVEGFGARMPTAFPIVARVVDFETGDPLLFHEPVLLSSSLSSVIEADGSRSSGPFALGAASWRQDKESDRETRVLAIGDADWASNAYLPVQANRNLFLNAIAWLARESQLITVRRNELAGQAIELDPAEARILRTILVAPPLAVLVAGAWVAFRRRGR